MLVMIVIVVLFLRLLLLLLLCFLQIFTLLNRVSFLIHIFFSFLLLLFLLIIELVNQFIFLLILILILILPISLSGVLIGGLIVVNHILKLVVLDLLGHAEDGEGEVEEEEEEEDGLDEDGVGVVGPGHRSRDWQVVQVRDALVGRHEKTLECEVHHFLYGSKLLLKIYELELNQEKTSKQLWKNCSFTAEISKETIPEVIKLSQSFLLLKCRRRQQHIWQRLTGCLNTLYYAQTVDRKQLISRLFLHFFPTFTLLTLIDKGFSMLYPSAFDFVTLSPSWILMFPFTRRVA